MNAARGACVCVGLSAFLCVLFWQILAQRPYGTAVDWWGLGTILHELLVGAPPWYTRDRDALFRAIRAAPLALPAYLSPPAVELLRALL